MWKQALALGFVIDALVHFDSSLASPVAPFVTYLGGIQMVLTPDVSSKKELLSFQADSVT